MIYNTKQELLSQYDLLSSKIKESCSAYEKIILSFGCKMKMEIYFSKNGKRIKKPKDNSCCDIIAKISVFPNNLLECTAIEKNLCPRMYVTLGKCSVYDDAYIMDVHFKKVDSLLRFLNKYANRLKKYRVETALYESVSDVFRWLCNLKSYGNDRPARKNLWLNISGGIILGILLLIFFIVRMLTPSAVNVDWI